MEISTPGYNVIVVIFLLGLLGGCAEGQNSADATFTTFEDFSSQSRTAEIIPDSVDYFTLVQANNALAVQFFQYTNVGIENTLDATNGVVSSYGLSQTLAMVASGARGTTADEFPLGQDVSDDPMGLD